MSDTAIKVERLGKAYRIGATQARYQTLRESISRAASAPLNALRRIGQGGAVTSRSAAAKNMFWALRDISFELKRGDVLGIIGKNGAGKSTLLKILSRITEPTEGEAEIHGRVGSLLEVGTGFHSELTGRENIYLNGAILGMKQAEIRRKFDEIVAFAETERFIDTPVKHYSSGMYLRLAFAVAAHLEPEILIVDEVLAVGDAAFQRKCLGKMSEVASEGRTVMFVSHNMGAITRLCRTGMLLRAGQLVMLGDVESVVQRYLEENVALAGEVTLNSPALSELTFQRVRILNHEGAVSATVGLQSGVWVEMDYCVHRPVRGAQLVHRLWNSEGICVLSSTDFDTDPTQSGSELAPGEYVSRTHIPAEYLRPGSYSLDIIASIPHVKYLDQHTQCIGFEVIDTGSIDAVLSQKRSGVVAPILAWERHRIR